MFSNRTGGFNTAVGSASLRSNVIGSNNTAIAREALRDTTSIIATLGTITAGSGYTDGTYTGVTLVPDNNSWWTFPTADITVASGSVTLVTLVDAGVGMVAGATLTIDNSTAPAGLLAGSGFSIPISTVTTGANNTAIGFRAGQTNKIGNRNLFLGYLAGQNETGDDNLYISNSNTATPLIYGKFDSTGSTAGRVKINGNLEIKTKTPATAGADGVVGEIAWDADYIYICTATNTWKRSAIAGW
jgi:hypothetical protein